MEIKDLTVERGQVKVLNEINLTVSSPCECIVGANGAGKSTFLNAIINKIEFKGSINKKKRIRIKNIIYI